ncbi:MAG: hydantoinase [Alphaproteobacteria bacterium]|nr:MAG: hydantoinase [Alphaproteobacteria bacterium]
MGLLINIDNGGTLTDVCAVSGDQIFHGKTLTTPHDLSKCFMDALSVISGRIYGAENLVRLVAEVDHIRYSTTQGTNALVERKGPRLGLISNDKDLAERLQYDDHAKDLYQSIIGSRFAYIDAEEEGGVFENRLTAIVNELTAQGANRLIISFKGKDFSQTESHFRRLFYRKFPRHLLGAVPVIFSNELTLDEDITRRSWASILNSFLHPAMEHFLYNAEGELRSRKSRNPLLIYRSDGNSTRVARTVALNTYSSGPRGGVEGTKALLQLYGISNAISMDIGGTTTDIAVFTNQQVDVRRYGLVDAIETPTRLANIHSIGAGGSSIISLKDNKIQVGPESVGASPGPLCFGRGGDQPTITDVYLLMGYFDPASYFGGNLHLNVEKSREGIMAKIAVPLGLSLEEALQAMADAYHKKIADQMRTMLGNIDSHLIAFGGAGPMSACLVAEQLGLNEVLVPRMAAVFSAFGIGFSDIASSYSLRLASLDATSLKQAVADVKNLAVTGMRSEGFEIEECTLECRLIIADGEGEDIHDIDLNSPTCSAVSKDGALLEITATKPIGHYTLEDHVNGAVQKAEPTGQREGLFGRLPIFTIEDLKSGDTGQGPAILEEEFFTCSIPEGWAFNISSNQDVLLTKTTAKIG